jgi:hypothetical protein
MKRRRKYKFDHDSRNFAKSLGITQDEANELSSKYNEFTSMINSGKFIHNSHIIEYIVNNFDVFSTAYIVTEFLNAWRDKVEELQQEKDRAQKGDAVLKAIDTFGKLTEKSEIIKFIVQGNNVSH